MASNNETIADIVREMRSLEFDDPRLDIYSLMATRDLARGWANRIEAAHKRERKAGAEAAQICGEIGKMIGREAAGLQPVTDCNRLGNAAKDDERLTIVAIYENVIAAKDREIAELRECLREAVREKCPFTRMSCKHSEPCDYECGTEKWRKALEGSNNATK